MADLVQGTDVEISILPDGSIVVQLAGTGDLTVASSDYWEFDPGLPTGGTLNINVSECISAGRDGAV